MDGGCFGEDVEVVQTRCGGSSNKMVGHSNKMVGRRREGREGGREKTKNDRFECHFELALSACQMFGVCLCVCLEEDIVLMALVLCSEMFFGPFFFFLSPGLLASQLLCPLFFFLRGQT